MAEVEVLRARLLEQQRHAQESIVELGGSIEAIVTARQGSNSDDEHDPEGSTLAFEWSHSEALRRQAEQRLQEIDAALSRMDAGTYGTCLVCAAPIAPARLEARPFAATCISCAS